MAPIQAIPLANPIQRKEKVPVIDSLLAALAAHSVIEQAVEGLDRVMAEQCRESVGRNAQGQPGTDVTILVAGMFPDH
ncbi:hypothetical protein A6723_002005 [Pseudomonas sp. AU11447]|nr:hypothetical protein A6723_002005 [Pseudomonas sp. AU11447]